MGKVKLEEYIPLVGESVVQELYELARPLKGKRVVHVNATKSGGGVAEILLRMQPLMEALGLHASWEIIQGDPDFFECTKGFHNALQGSAHPLADHLFDHYKEVNRRNAKTLPLNDADFVMIHDPQPAALIEFFPERKGKWIWRCHIDTSAPDLKTWNFLKQWISRYDASIFTLAEYAHSFPHPVFLVPPSIDPFTEKNKELPQTDVDAVRHTFGIDPKRPLILQVSRFDRFKDPVGVIRAYRIAKKKEPRLQLVLAGGTASDDPEGAAVLSEVREAVNGDSDIHVLLLPPDAHLVINALQRAADVVIQKSLKEGFGLTVTEALWKGKAVIGGDVGGIRLQVKNNKTGFLVDTPEEAASLICELLEHREKSRQMGENGRELVRENFLITRHLKDYLTIMRKLR